MIHVVPSWNTKGGTTVGPGLSFAKAALADTTQRIYMVPAAWGASGFCKVNSELLAWNAELTSNSALGGSGLLERALTRLTITMRETGGMLRGILWHDLVPLAYPCGSSSCVYFGATANRETGRRFYNALTRIWNR